MHRGPLLFALRPNSTVNESAVPGAPPCPVACPEGKGAPPVKGAAPEGPACGPGSGAGANGDTPCKPHDGCVEVAGEALPVIEAIAPRWGVEGCKY